jgi:hypothetical protein
MYNNDKDKSNNKKQGGGDVVEFTLKRVMKNLNNYILNEYQKLFFTATVDTKEPNSESVDNTGTE